MATAIQTDVYERNDNSNFVAAMSLSIRSEWTLYPRATFLYICEIHSYRLFFRVRISLSASTSK